ncbi:MAG: hypothetical protein JXA07_05680 [Spirochaetes bacterium]|nr:hypothetical protein [Spirochaetota bacterium]
MTRITVYPIMLAVLILFGMNGFSEVYEPDKLRVHIRMDKKYFYSDEDVTLQICVTNESERKNYFVVYDPAAGESSDYTTFQPMVFDMEAREAEIIVPYKIEQRAIGDLVKGLERRVVELAPGETFIHAVDLKVLFMLKLNTAYRVQGLFYPSFEDGAAVKSDNELSFRMIESKYYTKPSQIDAIERTLLPDEVMLLTLKAEKDRAWDRWIKYINVEKYIDAFPEFVQKYRRANYEEKSRIEKDFIRFVTRERDDYLLDYKIIRQDIEKGRNIAYVYVMVDRFGTRVTSRYKCKYTLEQYKNLWLITDEEATVMKGAKR